MMERFFEYSRTHGKPIRLLTQTTDPEGKTTVRYVNAIAVSWNERTLSYIRPRKSDMGKPPLVLPLDQILSANYARGDRGDTLQFTEE